MPVSPQSPQKPLGRLSVPQGRRWTPVKITILVLSLVVLVVVGSVAWWLISPFFIHTTAHDANLLAPSSTSVHSATPGPSTTPVRGNNGPVTLANGNFIDTGSGDHGSGKVAIGKTAAGQYVIHLEHFNVTNGPDLHVYLATPADPTDASQVTNGGVDLGTLSATEGSVNVTVPTNIGIHLKTYHSVVIYCKSFSAIFTIAPLQFASAS